MPSIVGSPRRLPEGKLPISILEPLLKSVGQSGNDLVVPPSIGVDVGVTRTSGKYLVSSSDPITGTVKRIGWHAVNVSANDVATSGIMPSALTVVSLFPERDDVKHVKFVMREIYSTSEDLGITVAGGHTEITPGLNRPIIVVTCFGSGNKFVTASMARENDSILMTKSAGIEGTSILSRLERVHRYFSSKETRRAENLIQKLSIVSEAKSAFSTGKVHAMHDTTEGGTLGSLVEMSIASRLGFELQLDLVPVEDSTRSICRLLTIDPMKLIGSGSLLIACSQRSEREVIEAVENGSGVRCTMIGRFTSRRAGKILVKKNGSSTKIEDASIQDELWQVLSKYGDFS